MSPPLYNFGSVVDVGGVVVVVDDDDDVAVAMSSFNDCSEKQVIKAGSAPACFLKSSTVKSGVYFIFCCSLPLVAS